MGFICLAGDSHEVLSLIFFEKYFKILECHLHVFMRVALRITNDEPVTKDPDRESIQFNIYLTYTDLLAN